MKTKRKFAATLLIALTFASAAAIADGCLQGTWHYYNAGGQLVGEQTVGCGELDGVWGAVTSRSTFTQGCAASF